MLDFPIEVEIADDRSVRASKVFRYCVLRLFEDHYLVDLVPTPLRGRKVIIGMDWLSPNGAVIDCAQQLVRIRTPGGGELVIQGVTTINFLSSQSQIKSASESGRLN